MGWDVYICTSWVHGCGYGWGMGVGVGMNMDLGDGGLFIYYYLISTVRVMYGM
jgi:hypothetical protein